MKVTGFVKKGEYFDSVSIMLVAKQVAAIKGVIDSSMVMGTEENKSVLKATGLFIPEFAEAGEMDLIAVMKTEDNADMPALLKSIEGLLKSDNKSKEDN